MLQRVGVLLAGVLVLMAGNGLVGTWVGLSLGERGASELQVGLVASAYYAGLFVGALRLEALVLRVGHVRAFAAFGALFAASCLGLDQASSTWAWDALRFLAGGAMVGLFMVTESWLAGEEEAHRGRLLSAYMIAIYAGLGIGQLLVALPDPGSRRLGLAALLAAVGIAAVALSPTSPPPPPRIPRISAWWLAGRAPLGVAAGVVSGLAAGAVYGLGPLFALQVGLDDRGVATFMASAVFGGLVLQAPVGRASDHLDRRLVLAGVAGAAGLAALALAHAGELVLLCLAGASFGGLAFTLYPLGLAYVLDRVPPERSLGASSTLLLAYAAGSTAGPALLSPAMSARGPGGLWEGVAVLTALLSLAASAAFLRRPPVAEPEPLVVLPRTSPELLALHPLVEEPPIGAER